MPALAFGLGKSADTDSDGAGLLFKGFAVSLFYNQVIQAALILIHQDSVSKYHLPGRE